MEDPDRADPVGLESYGDHTAGCNSGGSGPADGPAAGEDADHDFWKVSDELLAAHIKKTLSLSRRDAAPNGCSVVGPSDKLNGVVHWHTDDDGGSPLPQPTRQRPPSPSSDVRLAGGSREGVRAPPEPAVCRRRRRNLLRRAMDGETCVGAIVCKLDVHKKLVKRGYIAMLAVDSKYRKRKIGSTLVLKAIRAMINDDADEVVLETEITNKPALRLYENLGFVRDKRLFRYYLNGVDALRLKLWLL
ncbi:hypothetical protein HPB51_007129 [Rhipicephalus microplus]|uniref:N-acetyltransferase domain-containing protein n=1 Tax=Rhipicephalus microplus TaxID=6941 RepID=A0A9J6DZA1_RHIMP|nr:hypothetical protein HPB51_007129 [Rhipicephalus microplus]